MVYLEVSPMWEACYTYIALPYACVRWSMNREKQTEKRRASGNRLCNKLYNTASLLNLLPEKVHPCEYWN